MRIKEVNISNYRQYKNLSFSFDKLYDKDHDLHIIIAQNGVGKSNFLNAITWCLYEEESHLQDKYKALPIVNLDTINSTPDKVAIIVQVEIKIEINGEIQKISRRAFYKKNELAKNKIVKTDTEFEYTKKGFDPILGFEANQTFEDDAAKAFVNKIFPQGISEYFFFDNEQMNNYFTANAGGSIQSAINTITKVNLVQTVNGRLKSAQNEYKVDLGSGNDKIKKLQDDAETARKRYEDENEELGHTAQQIITAEKMKAEIEEEIKGAENLKVLELKRATLIDKKNKLLKEIDEKNKEIDAFIVRYTTLINMYPAFKKTFKLIKKKDEDKKLPPEISMEILKRSVDKKVCQVCGMDLDEEHFKIVLEKLTRFNISSPAYELLLTIRQRVTDLIKETESYPIKRKKILSELQKLQDEYEKVDKERLEIDNEMKNVPNKEEVLQKIDKREALESQIRKLYSSKGTIQERVKRYKKEAEDADSKCDAAIQKQLKDNIKTKKLEATKRLMKYLLEAEKEIIEEIREEISKETFNNFINLIWKENTYSKIKIDENYNVDLIHKRGYSAIGSTSAAERALLALSFTNAIHKVSKFESPLVIDSPVGRVSDDNRRRFSETLAEVSKNKQIIMLFTPDEYSKDVSDVFDLIATKSKASMNDSEEITTIKGV